MTFQFHNRETYEAACESALRDPEGFWAAIADSFDWSSRWTKVAEPDFYGARNQWFIGGQLNITVNCIDRHLPDRADQPALIWEPNDPTANSRTLTYGELAKQVNHFANGLRRLGLGKGDRVCFYMPMVPELVIGILACARIGAIHSVVFAGFSAQSLAERIQDAGCKMVICADVNYRGAKAIPVKEVVDQALAMGCPTIEHVVVYQQNPDSTMNSDDTRVLSWETVLKDTMDICSPEIMDSEDPLFILYTSGSTGKPKGVVHTCGGYMVYTAYTFANVFQYRQGEIFWCTADIGWITGHSYLVYGPLLNGATTLMFEGVPTYPDPSRFWQICEKHKVNIFYTAPTAIRALMASGDQYTENHDLSSLRVIGSVGEPINEEAWHWYSDKIGRGKAPVVDTWWQTETGGIMISPIPHITDQKPSWASYPLPGIMPVLLDTSGNEITETELEGLLYIRYPWPGIIRTTWNDHERCRMTYFGPVPGMYFTGDAAKRDKAGRYRIIGRIDDVINVSGHRLGTAEIENAINEHPDVVESAVVGYPHDIKGQGIFAFVITLSMKSDEQLLHRAINELMTRVIGPIAKIDHLVVVSGLPKTRSGKIMRRILRKVAERDVSNLGDISTLLNPEVVEEILTRTNLRG